MLRCGRRCVVLVWPCNRHQSAAGGALPLEQRATCVCLSFCIVFRVAKNTVFGVCPLAWIPLGPAGLRIAAASLPAPGRRDAAVRACGLYMCVMSHDQAAGAGRVGFCWPAPSPTLTSMLAFSCQLDGWGAGSGWQSPPALVLCLWLPCYQVPLPLALGTFSRWALSTYISCPLRARACTGNRGSRLTADTRQLRPRVCAAPGRAKSAVSSFPRIASSRQNGKQSSPGWPWRYFVLWGEAGCLLPLGSAAAASWLFSAGLALPHCMVRTQGGGRTREWRNPCIPT